MTLIALLFLAAFGVAGLLFWWTARFDTAAADGSPPLSYAPAPSPPWIHVNGNGVPLLADAPVFQLITAGSQPVATRTPVRPREAERDAETVRFVRSWDFSVQLLPGRLEVLEGATPHREIRFLHVPGEQAQVIIGRELGLTPHYIGLGSPTVSRRHAQFDFVDNRWIVKNLSRTNPLIVNDDELYDTEAARPLAHGDRLELGDVVLRFHAH